MTLDSGFEILRFSSDNNQLIECYAGHPIGAKVDGTIVGTLGISREGDTISGWIDRGSGPVLIGSESSANFLGPKKVRIWANQQKQRAFEERPSTALDVSFDNFVATADIITPEPATLILLTLGSILTTRHRS